MKKLKTISIKNCNKSKKNQEMLKKPLNGDILGLLMVTNL